jgi:hypothetical protein
VPNTRAGNELAPMTTSMGALSFPPGRISDRFTVHAGTPSAPMTGCTTVLMDGDVDASTVGEHPAESSVAAPRRVVLEARSIPDGCQASPGTRRLDGQLLSFTVLSVWSKTYSPAKFVK